jgi:hypothetical protein
MRKMYCGNLPLDWDEVGRWVDKDGVEWVMFKKQQAHSADWATFKVCASTKAPHKANYWFARNYKTGQTAYAKDLVVMKNSRPEMWKVVEELF